MGSRHIFALQEQHDALDFLLFCPSAFYSVNSLLADVWNFDKTFRFRLYHVQRILTKLGHDELCKLRTNTLDKAGAEVFLDTVDRSRKCLFKRNHLKLTTVF